ncbi:OadG family protein [Blastochloris viridis]|uniref:OadG family protein n=1 Tax=Blastochloris viridis TaxID=1079 RepID=UPI00147073EB|nr:OadG family protein [Blastochloris viridis]
MIDFLLSFVIIAGIGVVLTLLPLINRLGRKDEAAQAEPTPAEQHQAELAAIRAAHVPVIAAAVHAVFRAGHVVRIEGPLQSSSWAGQGRARLLAHAAGSASRSRPAEPPSRREPDAN